MSDVKNLMRIVVSSALNELIKSKGGECILPENVAVETPPNSQMGDLGSPMFAFAKSLKTSPQSIASEVLKIINEKQSFDGVSVSSVGEFLAVGPYVNVKLNKGDASSQILKKIYEQKEEYGSFNSEGKKPLASRKGMIEWNSFLKKEVSLEYSLNSSSISGIREASSSSYPISIMVSISSI